MNTKNDFNPSWWCRGSHAQTIAGALFRRGSHVKLKRERLKTSDNDILILDWLLTQNSDPIIVIAHGLGGSVDSPYIKSLLKEIKNKNYQVVIVNARGSLEPNQKPVMSNAGFIDDIDCTIQQILNRKISNQIFLLGYSIGGSQVLNYLGREGRKHSQIKKACVISVPYNLEKAVRHLDKGFNLFYTNRMLKNLIPQALSIHRQFPNLLNNHQISQSTTFTHFDTHATAPLAHYKSAQDYWRDASSEYILHKIEIPTLLIHAENDSFLPKNDLPQKTIQSNPNLHLLLTKDGGHLGFIDNEKWLESTIASFFTK